MRNQSPKRRGLSPARNLSPALRAERGRDQGDRRCTPSPERFHDERAQSQSERGHRSTVIQREGGWFEHADNLWSVRGGTTRFVYGRDTVYRQCRPDGNWRFRNGRCFWVCDHRERWVECLPGGLPESEAQAWLDSIGRGPPGPSTRGRIERKR